LYAWGQTIHTTIMSKVMVSYCSTNTSTN